MSTHRMFTVRNNKTGKTYSIDEEAMKKLKADKKDVKYTIVDERVAVTTRQTTMIPPEIREATAGAQRAIAGLAGEPTKEQPAKPKGKA